MRTVLLISFLCFLHLGGNAQIITVSQGDTLLRIEQNGTIRDYSHNYMGVITQNGWIQNGQNLSIGRIDESTGKIYNSLEDEIGFFNGSQLFDYDSSLVATVNGNSIYDSENNLVASFYGMIALKALFLTLFYF
jgi:hypothetical protein